MCTSPCVPFLLLALVSCASTTEFAAPVPQAKRFAHTARPIRLGIIGGGHFSTASGEIETPILTVDTDVEQNAGVYGAQVGYSTSELFELGLRFYRFESDAEITVESGGFGFSGDAPVTRMGFDAIGRFHFDDKPAATRPWGQVSLGGGTLSFDDGTIDDPTFFRFGAALGVTQHFSESFSGEVAVEGGFSFWEIDDFGPTLPDTDAPFLDFDLKLWVGLSVHL